MTLFMNSFPLIPIWAMFFIFIQIIKCEELSGGHYFANNTNYNQQQQQKFRFPYSNTKKYLSFSPTSLPSSRSLPASHPYPVDYYWNKEEFPNPLEEPYKCRQTKSSLLCDPDQLLDPNESNEIRDLLSQAKQSTKCFCLKCPPGEAGIKVGLALAKNIYSAYNDVSNQAAQTFADYLRVKWHYSLCNDSILILLVQSYPNQKSSITTSMGHIVKRVFSREFYQNLIYNQTVMTAAATEINNGGTYFQILRTMLTSINEYIEQIDPSIYQYEDTAFMSAMSDDSGNSTTALIVVIIIIGFIFLLAMIIGGIIMLKSHYERDQDPEFPEIDYKSPLGYQAAATDESQEKQSTVSMAVEEDEDDDSNQKNHQIETTVNNDEILGDDSLISTPHSSPK